MVGWLGFGGGELLRLFAGSRCMLLTAVDEQIQIAWAVASQPTAYIFAGAIADGGGFQRR